MKINRFFNFLIILIWIPSAFAVDVPLSDVSLEARAKSLFYEIRCMVCSSETIADSHAEVASDMRRYIREKISDGVASEKIKIDLAAQYGDVILMNPPLKTNTILLWFGPWLVLFLGGVAVFYYFRGAKSTGIVRGAKLQEKP